MYLQTKVMGLFWKLSLNPGEPDSVGNSRILSYWGYPSPLLTTTMACGEGISAAFCGKCWPRCFVSHATSSLALLHAGEESCLAANMVRACPTRGYTNHIITRNQLCWSKWRVSSHSLRLKTLFMITAWHLLGCSHCSPTLLPGGCCYQWEWS